MQYKFHQQGIFFFTGCLIIFFYYGMQPIHFIQKLYFILVLCFKKYIKVFTAVEPAGNGFIWIVFSGRILCSFLFQFVGVGEVLAENGTGGFLQ